MNIWDTAILIWSLLLLLPVLVLAVEVLAALLPVRPAGAPAPARCAVLVPAHNEEAGITATLASIKAQLGPQDRLLVVADNCTDHTADVASAAGAEVIERHDPIRRGKGFALDYGVRALATFPPDVVVIVDADCLMGPSAIGLLVGEASRSGRPVQAAYLLDTPPGAPIQARLSAFAFRFKNLVRPLGLARLGFPCLLTGSGMAFPWLILKDAPLASGNIVEDMQLGLDLALAGHPPQLCAQAQVAGVLPSGPATAYRQRKRWEHGHLRTMLTQVPRLLGKALLQRRIGLLGLALDLCVPPLSILVLLGATTGIVTALAGLSSPALLLGCGGLVLIATLLTAWARFGRNSLSFEDLLAAPFYVLSKVPILLSFLFRPQRAWVRTTRDPAPANRKISE